MLLSIGDKVRPGTYRFHSRFSCVVNFEHRGHLIAVVDETVGPGPLNIVFRNLADAVRPSAIANRSQITVPLPLRDKTRVRKNGAPTGTAVTKVATPALAEPPPLQISRSAVVFEGHGYHFASRHRYNSTLDLEAVDLRRLRLNLCALGEFLKSAAPPKSLAFLLDNRRFCSFRRGFESAFAEQIAHGVDQIFHGSLLAGVRELKGCGPGLTPAGDDFIAGLLIGLRVFQKLGIRNLPPTIDAIFRAARGENLFSNTFLDLARYGLLFGRMKDLLRALSSGGKGAVRKAAERLFAVGASSGADLATGFFMLVHDQNRFGDPWGKRPHPFGNPAPARTKLRPALRPLASRA